MVNRLLPISTLFALLSVGIPTFAADTTAPILTPVPAATPRINGAKVFGVRPGSPLLFTIAATGDRPMTFTAKELPAGVRLDPATGIFSGTIAKAGTYLVTLTASNAKGTAERDLRLVVGDDICLTPPMGWNSWNCWGGAVSQEKVAASAHALVTKGLRDHGWTYINIDDGWQGVRGGEFNAIQPNTKFPDMKALADEVHGLGLKFGIYSTPWRGTYEGHIGSSCDNLDGTYDWIVANDCNEFMRIGADPNADPKARKEKRRSHWKHGKNPFFAQDAKQWSAWGIDYMKYDWYPIDVDHAQAMHQALAATDRDIVYSLSNNAPLQSAADWARIANLWRTTPDISDSWNSMSKIGFDKQDSWTEFAGPGHWNDTDMMVVGQVGWGPKLHPSRLTADEQYTHISLWALLAAPLLIGCDLAQLDDFTTSLLSNDEVLEIDQDPLGKQGRRVVKNGDEEVYIKPLEDGSIAVGLFNRGTTDAKVIASWKDLGISGKQQVRDVWRQQDLSINEEQFSSPVASHGVRLVRIIPVKP